MQPQFSSPSGDQTRVVIVDDSAIVRGLIIKELETHPEIAVVGRAANGEAALVEIGRLRPDVVVLDLEMPVMDGMTALPLIVERFPDVRVVIASTLSQRNARISLDALAKGAHDYVPKPSTGSLVDAAAFHEELARKIVSLGATVRPAVDAPLVVRPAAANRPAPKVLAIGGSTGAPPVLMELFAALKPVRQPILVTQHMPATFTELLAEQLGRAGERPCAEARDGEAILPGHAYIAPGGWHMTVGTSGMVPVIRLNQEPPEHFCRPSVDPMLRSAAATYRDGLFAVILTGMGSDGAEGCQAVASHGGRFIVQDQESSVVWGMPGAAARTGLAEAIVPKSELGAVIRRAMGSAE